MLDSVYQRVHCILRHRYRHPITDAVLGVKPEVGRCLAAAGQGDQQVLRHFALGQRILQRHGAVNIETQGRLVGRLLEVQVGRSPSTPARRAHQLIGHFAVACQVFPDYPRMSIGAGRPKLRIWLTMSAGRNEKLTPGRFFRRAASSCSTSTPERPASGFSDTRISASAGANRQRRIVGQVNAADGQANVVDDAATWVGPMTRRTSFSTSSTTRAVSSIARAGARTRICSRISLPSMVGKKSWPRNGTSVIDTKKTSAKNDNGTAGRSQRSAQQAPNTKASPVRISRQISYERRWNQLASASAFGPRCAFSPRSR